MDTSALPRRLHEIFQRNTCFASLSAFFFSFSFSFSIFFKAFLDKGWPSGLKPKQSVDIFGWMFIWQRNRELITPHPKVAFSSAGGPPIPFSADIINGVLVMKHLKPKEGLLLLMRATVRDVLARKWVTRNDSIQRKAVRLQARGKYFVRRSWPGLVPGLFW